MPELAEWVCRFNSFECVIPSDEPANRVPDKRRFCACWGVSGVESRDLLFEFFSSLSSGVPIALFPMLWSKGDVPEMELRHLIWGTPLPPACL
jgi:hypothetical protein